MDLLDLDSNFDLTQILLFIQCVFLLKLSIRPLNFIPEFEFFLSLIPIQRYKISLYLF